MMLDKLRKSTTDRKTMFEHPNRNAERGNVLFLILIAVALFAALSYAVTQSSRSGAGNASNETNLINSATITQYPATVRTSIIRMIVSGGADPATLNFDSPNQFATTCNATPANCVFHPNGGGATFAQAPADIMADSQPGDWSFNGDFEIVNLGITSSGSTDGNEIIAFLPGVREGVCTSLNRELNFGTTPSTSASRAGTVTSVGYLRTKDNDQLTMEATNDVTLGTSGDENNAIFDGEPFGCFRNTSSGDFVYYHVLVER